MCEQLSRCTRLDMGQCVAKFAARHFQLESLLQIDPYVGRRAEVTAEAQGHVCGDTALLVHDVVDACGVTPITRASAWLESSIGTMNSSRRISPG